MRARSLSPFAFLLVPFSSPASEFFASAAVATLNPFMRASLLLSVGSTVPWSTPGQYACVLANGGVRVSFVHTILQWVGSRALLESASIMSSSDASLLAIDSASPGSGIGSTPFHWVARALQRASIISLSMNNSLDEGLGQIMCKHQGRSAFSTSTLRCGTHY